METRSNKLDFSNQNIYVGFDVHLKSWKVTVMTEEVTYKTFVQDPKPEILHQYLKKNFPGGNYFSAYEVGFCGYWIHNKLKSLGINSCVINPADIPTSNKEKVQKEDKRDSRKIARSLRNGDLIPIYVPTTKSIEDRGLVRSRNTLVKEKTRYKNRIKSFLYFHGIDIPVSFSKSQSNWSKRFISWLESIKMEEESAQITLSSLIAEVNHLRVSVLDVSRKIRKLSESPSYKENIKLLRSVPGIGLTTAMEILTEIETIDRFNNLDKLCSYIGFVPSTHSSGEKDKTGDITPRGHSILRSVLIESAWIAIRNDPALTKSFHEYCKRMDPNKAIVRIAKKLLSRIKYVLKNKQPYVCSIVR